MVKLYSKILVFIQVGASFCLAASLSTTAQIIPDSTLPSNSIITKQGNTNFIEGGTTKGSNLFHSFEQFSVLNGNTAYFNNTVDIQNIFSRVTSGSVSNINGILRANGTANLWLLNSNGIVFGPNAQLNIGGSFIGTTASSINFADNTQFSATVPQTTPLLTVSVPIGLGFGSNSGEIILQGSGYNLANPASLLLPITVNSSTGLRVQPGKTLAIVGGNLTLNAGILTAEEGRIELGSVNNGLVSINPIISGWILDYKDVSSFKDIQLSQQSLVHASGNSSSSIQVQGSNVALNDGSIILLQNQGLMPSGQIILNASQSLQINGTNSSVTIPSGLFSDTLGHGEGGDIKISTEQLVLRNGGVISTRTFGAKPGGNIVITSSDSIQLIRFSPLNPRFYSSIGSSTLGSGKGGNITLSTAKLTALDGGGVGAAAFGNGIAGNVKVDVADAVELIGVNRGIFLSSGLVSSGTSGESGKVTVNTSRLSLQDGGTISASTIGSGKAGSVIINASDSVDVSGTVPGSVKSSLIISSAQVVDERLRQLGELPPKLSGTSGDVTINTSRLSVTNGGQISVRNDGAEDAGNLKINADSVRLDNQARITASTQSAQGGNIKIKSADLLSMRRNSQISTNAGNAQAGGDGGQININTKFLVAPSLENSDITANAFSGKGGNVNISATAIFGLVPRSREELQALLRTDNPNELDPSRLPSSDITAISQTNPSLSGDLTIITPSIDPNNGLVNLPVVITDLSNSIGQECANTTVGPGASKFIITGRGGLPEDPTKPLNGQTIWTDSRLFLTTEKPSPQPSPSTQPTDSTAIPLTEASLVEINSKGEAVLTAAASNLQVPWVTPSCHAS